MPRALITGAGGFVGQYLTRELLAHGYEVICGTHHHVDVPEGGIAVSLDVTDQASLRRLLARYSPDEVYHLAGIARPGSEGVADFYDVHVTGTLNLLEAVRAELPDAAVLTVGSGYCYGPSDEPLSEHHPLEPINHYGVSKASADMMSRAYAREGMNVVCARPFNHSGPGQGPAFVLPVLVMQFAEILNGERAPVIELGGTESVRDFSDVRDVVRGYRLALERGQAGEAYNFGSGRGVRIGDLVELVRERAGVDVELRIDPSRIKGADPLPHLVADVGKAARNLGWRAEIPLRQTVDDMLAAARQHATR